MIKISIAFLVLFFCCNMLSAQQAVYNEINKLIQEGRSFPDENLVHFISQDLSDRSLQLEGLTEGTILKIDAPSIEELSRGDNKFIRLSLPVSERADIKLILVRHEIFAEDFALFSSSEPGIPIDYRSGIHYKGIIEGNPTSLVALSVFEEEVMALITSEQGNMVLGRIENDRESRHVLYHEKDLTKTSPFTCETPDDGRGYTTEDITPQQMGRDVGDCVRVYIEIDDDIVTQKGGATPATNYITGLFNQSIVLYNNETVNMTISEILAWTTPAPYSGSSAGAMLTSFQANTGEFNGNVGHLVSYQASGGIAVLDNLCSSNPDWRKCFSSIASTYANVPTYSWSAMVITHEMGHVIGSKHTHACAWNGNNTAIDGCAGATEGGCPLPAIPPIGGTLMSYCHITNVGINFALGFGTQPGNVIRNRVNASGNCLTSCGAPPPPPPPAYCASNGTNSSYEWVQKVILGSINNTSGNNGGYGNYTNLSATLNAGTAYTINLTPAFVGSPYTEHWRVWVDYNGDLDWNDSGEQVAQGTGSVAINLPFTVPSSTPAGSKRMRVSMKYGGYPSVCGSFSYGEVEDYTVVIGGGGGGSNPTCSDGVQNQGETGVDCGGPCPACPPPPPPPPPPGGEVVLLASYFETGWDSWVDGGIDALRVNSTNSYEGLYSIRLADNSGSQSAMTSPALNFSNATGAEIGFYFKAINVEVGEDFWIQYKVGSGAWTTISQVIQGTHFNNNTFYTLSLAVPNFIATPSAKFRIQCDASDDTDQIFIDQVTITKLTGSSLVESGVIIKEVTVLPEDETNQNNISADKKLMVYPNPVNDVLSISFPGEIQAIRMMTIDGRNLKVEDEMNELKQINTQSLAPGLYFLWIQSGDEWYPVKFTKM